MVTRSWTRCPTLKPLRRFWFWFWRGVTNWLRTYFGITPRSKQRARIGWDKTAEIVCGQLVLTDDYGKRVVMQLETDDDGNVLIKMYCNKPRHGYVDELPFDEDFAGVLDWEIETEQPDKDAEIEPVEDGVDVRIDADTAIQKLGFEPVTGDFEPVTGSPPPIEDDEEPSDAVTVYESARELVDADEQPDSNVDYAFATLSNLNLVGPGVYRVGDPIDQTFVIQDSRTHTIRLDFDQVTVNGRTVSKPKDFRW